MVSSVSPAAANRQVPRLSVVIPSRNEARHIAACLASVEAALEHAGGGEILVADGMSTDGSRELVEERASRNRAIRLLDNPDRTTPYAFNLGIRAAASDRIAIVSAHCTVALDFFEEGHRRLDAGTADIVGGPIRAEPAGPGGLAWLLAQVVSHPFGVGNSRFRVSTTGAYVDAVPFAIFTRETFQRIGLFNQALVRNQDTEFFGRAAREGIRVWLEPAMRSVYLSRATLGGLVSQGFRNAYWNVLVWRMRPSAFRWRHLIPALFATGLLLGGIAALLWPPVCRLFLAALGLYFLHALLAALDIARKRGRLLALLLPPIFFAYHLCYGLGSLAGLRHLSGALPDAAPPRFSTEG
jgi:glycosyltransferase involved in cell wall biosynthesis